MSNEGVDAGRRRFLTLTTTVVGGAGIVAWALPFLASLKPSAKAQAAGAPVKIENIDKIEPGQQVTYVWRQKPIFVVHRTPEMLESLKKVEGDLVDPQSSMDQQPDYAKNETRSIKPEFLVLIGTCTHLGCLPKFRPDHPAPEITQNWQGGYFCPCHGSKFDLAGRVITGSPAPKNLAVPPYRFADDKTLIIGEDSEQKGAA